MPTTTITTRMDEYGRLTVPKPARKKLGVEGEETTVEVEVRVDE